MSFSATISCISSLWSHLYSFHRVTPWTRYWSSSNVARGWNVSKGFNLRPNTKAVRSRKGKPFRPTGVCPARGAKCLHRPCFMVCASNGDQLDSWRNFAEEFRVCVDEERPNEASANNLWEIRGPRSSKARANVCTPKEPAIISIARQIMQLPRLTWSIRGLESWERERYN